MIDYSLFPSPCYIMEEDLLRRNLRLIQHVAQEADVEIILAFKAFALWKSFPIFREYIGHTTASSLYEARLAFEEFGSKAHTYSPAYTEGEFADILRCSSHITFNSLTQFERFYPMVQAHDERVSCGLRINPEYSEIEITPVHQAHGLVLRPTNCPTNCQQASKVSIVIVTANHRHTPCSTRWSI